MSRVETVLVTGGHGFLGRWLVRQLGYEGFLSVPVGSTDYDLRDAEQVRRLFYDFRDKVQRPPDYVIHAAANVGGIRYNRANQADIMSDNIAMASNVLSEVRYWGCKTVLVGSVCMYPASAKTPFREQDIWDGYPEESNAGYGISKRVQMEMGIRCAQDYGLDIINVVPTNFYGPGDDFETENSHVIPALIRKFLRARKSKRDVELWGDGTPTRDFLHVQDVAVGIVQCMRFAKTSLPINLGSGEGISIGDLAAKIKYYVMGDMPCEISWTGERDMNGQQSRVVDTSRARELVGWRPVIGLDRGLMETAMFVDPQNSEGE